MRAIAVLVALLMLVPVSMPAQAASFDCAKAATSFEKAICADPAISRQDEILAQAYATALGGLSDPAAAEVKASQKSWLTYAERVCSDDAEPIASGYTDDQKGCLGATFGARITALEASRMQGGHRFYPLDRYLVQKDTEAEPDAFNKVADKAFHTIKIDRTDDVAAAFNAMIDTLVADQGTFFDAGTTTIASDDPSSDYDITTKVAEVTDQRISLETNLYWYGHGAAHGNYFITNHHFLVDAKRALVASDIFAGEVWQKQLGDLALAAVKEQLGDDYFANSDEDVFKIAIDPLRWSFTEAGLVIQFNIYEVTAYAMGAPKVTIPWDKLRNVLAEGADGLAGFY